MYADELFSFKNSSLTGEMIAESKMDLFFEQSVRELASSACLAWVRNGDSSPEILAEIVEMAQGYAEEDEEDEDGEEEDEAVEEALEEAFGKFGVSEDLAQRAMEGDEAAARRAFVLVEKHLEESGEAIEEMIFGFIVTANIQEEGAGNKSEWKKANRIKRLKRQGKRRKKRMTAAQRMAVRKMLRKSHRGVANLKRKKTVRKRKAAGFY